VREGVLVVGSTVPALPPCPAWMLEKSQVIELAAGEGTRARLPTTSPSTGTSRRGAGRVVGFVVAAVAAAAAAAAGESISGGTTEEITRGHSRAEIRACPLLLLQLLLL